MTAGTTVTKKSKTEGEATGALGPGQRWSVARKREVVLRILKGESLDALSRELALPMHTLEKWRDKARDAMDAGLRERAPDDPLQAEVDKAHQRIGELTMENELLLKRVEKSSPFASRKSRR